MRPPMRPVAKIPASPRGPSNRAWPKPPAPDLDQIYKVASCKHPIYVVVDILKYGPLALAPY